jgi:hypothetical protein
VSRAFIDHRRIPTDWLACLLVDTPPDDPITQPTNRGNKLKANATYVHEGALGFSNPHELYKEASSFHPLRLTMVSQKDHVLAN